MYQHWGTLDFNRNYRGLKFKFVHGTRYIYKKGSERAKGKWREAVIYLIDDTYRIVVHDITGRETNVYGRPMYRRTKRVADTGRVRYEGSSARTYEIANRLVNS